MERTLEIGDKIILNEFDITSIPQKKDYSLRLSEYDLAQKKLDLKISRQKRPGNLNFKSQYSDSGTSSDYTGTLTYSFDFGKTNPKFDIQISDWYLSSAKQEIALERLKSISRRNEIVRRFNTLKKSLEISEKKLESATESYEYAKIAIQKGLISSLDLQDAQNKLTQAQLDRLSDIIAFNKLKYEAIVIFGNVI